MFKAQALLSVKPGQTYTFYHYPSAFID